MLIGFWYLFSSLVPLIVSGHVMSSLMSCGVMACHVASSLTIVTLYKGRGLAIPSQLFTFSRSYLPLHIICVVHSVFKLPGHPAATLRVPNGFRPTLRWSCELRPEPHYSLWSADACHVFFFCSSFARSTGREQNEEENAGAMLLQLLKGRKESEGHATPSTSSEEDWQRQARKSYRSIIFLLRIYE